MFKKMISCLLPLMLLSACGWEDSIPKKESALTYFLLKCNNGVSLFCPNPTDMSGDKLQAVWNCPALTAAIPGKSSCTSAGVAEDGSDLFEYQENVGNISTQFTFGDPKPTSLKWVSRGIILPFNGQSQQTYTVLAVW